MHRPQALTNRLRRELFATPLDGLITVALLLGLGGHKPACRYAAIAAARADKISRAAYSLAI
jgi:hypothetical protein